MTRSIWIFGLVHWLGYAKPTFYRCRNFRARIIFMTSSENPSSIDFWLPDLCNALAFLRLILLGIFVAIALTLVREGFSGFEPERTGQLFLYTVWVVFTSAVGLCQLRRWGKGLSISVSVALAILWLAIAATLCSLAAYQLTRPFSMPLFWTTSAPIRLFPLWVETTLVTLILGCLALRSLYVHYEMQKQQRLLMQAKYDALQARIRPHFLFNSLNSIAAMIGIDPAKAEDAVLDLSDLLRRTLGEKSAHALRDELSLCKKYLDIEKLRMAERMQVQMSVNPEAEAFFIPSLSLQPLLENAVLHGLQQIPEGGEIRVGVDLAGASDEKDRTLVIEISNPVTRRPAESQGTGSALTNINTRLKQFYRSKVSMDCAQKNDRFVVKIQIHRPDKTRIRYENEET